MTKAGPFPFDAEKLAALTAWSRSLDGTPIAPIAAPLVVDERGFVWSPAPDGSDDVVGSYLHAGMRMGWAPLPERGGVILIQWGGPASDPAFEDDGISAFLTRDGLRALIADLHSIDVQLGDASCPTTR